MMVFRINYFFIIAKIYHFLKRSRLFLNSNLNIISLFFKFIISSTTPILKTIIFEQKNVGVSANQRHCQVKLKVRYSRKVLLQKTVSQISIVHFHSTARYSRNFAKHFLNHCTRKQPSKNITFSTNFFLKVVSFC